MQSPFAAKVGLLITAIEALSLISVLVNNSIYAPLARLKTARSNHEEADTTEKYSIFGRGLRKKKFDGGE